MLQQRPDYPGGPGHASNPLAKRDTRLDVMRAVCLLMIFVNHVPHNLLEYLTTKNFGFSDAAEAFVLISGLSAGYAYGKKFGAGQKLLTTLKAWRRATVLYAAHLAATLATIAIFSVFAMIFWAPELYQKINIAPVMKNPAEALTGIVILGHQLGYNNILPIYAGILLMAPLFLLIGRWRLSAMVAASGALWLVSGLFSIAPPNYPGEGNWFLNPLSWQFLFVIGMAATLHAARGGTIPRSRALFIACLSYLALSCAWVWIPLWGYERALGLPRVLGGFDKTYLSLPRLLHMLALAYVIVCLPRLLNLFRRAPQNPLAAIGRHGLSIFIFGTLLAMVCQALFYSVEVGPLTKLVVVAAGLAAHFAYAAYLEWYGRLKQGAKPLPDRIDTMIGPVRPAGEAGERQARPAARPQPVSAG